MIKWSEYIDVWDKVKRAARTTINREGTGKYPTDSWKKSILLAEHSPIRKIKFNFPQSALVEHECEADAQALINISRRRLCSQASPETRRAWQEVINEVAEVDPVLASVCQPECIYRGFCPEMKSCGYAETEEYKKRLEEYRKR